MVLVAALPLLLYRLGQSIHGSSKGGFVEALTIAQFPVVWFFAFLYYTDVASLFFVLLCYDTALRKSYALSSIVRSHPSGDVQDTQSVSDRPAVVTLQTNQHHLGQLCGGRSTGQRVEGKRIT